MLPTPHGAPEMGPVIPRGEETDPSRRQEIPTTAERPAYQEKQQTPHDSGPPMPVVPIPTAPAAPSQPAQTTLPVDDSPMTAADEDLIEKEWVEKAKKVISETKHDPYAQEQAVSRLQADYLHKRYGKTIKLPSED